ncbi:MAG: putative hemolysin [Candidatus Poriferisodalaceae bacterium]
MILVTLELAYLTLVFGELAPKRVAMQNPERWGLVMARPLAMLSKLTRPIVWMLLRSTDVAVRVMGGNPNVQRDEVTEEELRDMVAVQATFTPEQRQIIDGAFEIAQRTLDEILVPRCDVFVVDAQWSCAKALTRLALSGHRRVPVADDGGLDRVTGVVNLRQLQTGRMQLALVVDEHGGDELGVLLGAVDRARHLGRLPVHVFARAAAHFPDSGSPLSDCRHDLRPECAHPYPG